MSASPEPFRLSDGERNTALWLRLERHMRDILEASYTKIGNDAGLSETETAVLRGRIRCLLGLLDLGKARGPLE